MPDSVLNMEAAPAFRNRSAEIKDLAMALAKAQAAMTGASKDANNPHFKTKYADLASVWDAIRKPMTDNDLAVVQFPSAAGNGIEIETTIVHGRSGQFMSGVLWVPCSKNDAQGQGSAITYGRRYALMSVTGIAPVEEDDGNAAASTYKPAPGSAGAGGEFRPARRAPATTGQALALAREEGERDGLTQNAPPKPLPGAPAKRAAAPINTPADAGNAVKRLEWVKASRDYLADKDEHVARDWWIENKTRIDVIETALPKAFEELLDTYNQALERKVNT